jgi:bacterial/archaeal transporter family-2 protein
MFYSLLALVVGSLTSVQSRLNGQLSKDIHNGIAAALISFLTGWLFVILVCLLWKPDRNGLANIWKALRARRLKPWEVIGGMGGGFFVAIQSSTVPIIGVAIFTICAVGGQTISSMIVDLIGLSPSGKHKVTPVRAITAFITLISVTIAVYPDLQSATFRFAPILLAIIVGVVVSFQQAINGRVNVVSTRPLATTFLNFLMGSTVLTIALMINLARGGSIGTLPTNFVVYLGGIIGVIYIAVSAFTVRHIGILNMILFSVTGQLIGALLLDWLAPAAHTKVTAYLLTGTAMTLGAVLSSRLFTLNREKRARA